MVCSTQKLQKQMKLERVYLFEPQKILFELLKKFRDNAKFIVLDYAISDKISKLKHINIVADSIHL